jgi:hypothetical protein
MIQPAVLLQSCCFVLFLISKLQELGFDYIFILNLKYVKSIFLVF